MPRNPYPKELAPRDSAQGRANARILVDLSHEEIVRLLEADEQLLMEVTRGLAGDLSTNLGKFESGPKTRWVAHFRRLAQEGVSASPTSRAREFYGKAQSAARDAYWSSGAESSDPLFALFDKESEAAVGDLRTEAFNTWAEEQRTNLERGARGFDRGEAITAQQTGRQQVADAEEEELGFAREVSAAGVDPLSPEGQGLISLLAGGGTLGDERGQELVAQFRSRLISPLTQNPLGMTSPVKNPKSNDELRAMGIDPDILGLGPNPDYDFGNQNRYGYTKENPRELVDGFNTGELRRFQERAIAIGLISPDANLVLEQRKGGSKTLAAMDTIMAHGNRLGLEWEDTLLEFETLFRQNGDIGFGEGDGSGGAGGGGRTFRPEPYLAPDYATMAEQVDGMFRQTLQRAPDEAEVAQLVAEMTGWHKEAANVDMQAQRAGFDGAGGTIEAVDPVSRFKRFFKGKYAPEIDAVEDKEEAKVSRGVVEATSDTLSNMSRRGF